MGGEGDRTSLATGMHSSLSIQRQAEVDNSVKFLKEIGTCLDLCDRVVVNTPCTANESSNLYPLVDKGGTSDLSNSETWLQLVLEADKKLALVKARMENPPPPTPKKKPDTKLHLVKGHSGGAILRSSTRNKR